MTKTTHGRIHGKHIELDEDFGIADGQEVEVIVKPAHSERSQGERTGRWAGIVADDEAEFDDVFAQLERERKAARI